MGPKFSCLPNDDLAGMESHVEELAVAMFGDVNPFAQGLGMDLQRFFFLFFFLLVWNLENRMDKENEEGGWKNHSSRIGVTHKVVFLDKLISWITQVTKEIL